MTTAFRSRFAGKKFIHAFMRAQLLSNKLMRVLYLDYKPRSKRWQITDRQSEDSMTIRPIPPEVMATMRMK